MNKLLFFSAGALLTAPLCAQSLEGDFRKEGIHVRASYDEVTEVFQASSAALFQRVCDGYGVVMSTDGEILVKASEYELLENPSVIVGKKRYREVVVLATSAEWDVSLIKVDAEELSPIEFSESEPEHGSIVLSNSSSSRFKRRAQMGVIAANARTVENGKLAVLGIAMGSSQEGILSISGVSPTSGAKDAGLLKGDELVSVEGKEVSEQEEVAGLLDGKGPGDFAKIVVRRQIVAGEAAGFEEVEDPFAFVEENPPEFEDLEFDVELRERQEVFPDQLTRNDQMSGEFSKRRTNFSRIIQHDTSLMPRSTGGPLLTLDGKCVGMNIAFASRECSYAIPAKELQELYQGLRLKAGL